MPDASLIRDIGPLGLLCLAIYFALPSAVKSTMGIADAMARGRLELAAQPFEVLKTNLEASVKERELMYTRMDILATELMSLKSGVNELSALIKDLVHHVKKE